MRKIKCKNISKEHNEVKEYEFLRNEIMQKVELHNKLITFTITTTLTILTIAFSGLTLELSQDFFVDNSVLFIIPLLIIIPISLRIAYYRNAMSKLSAYIIVFLEDHIEGLNWETRHEDFKLNFKGKKEKYMVTSKYHELNFLSFICCALYVFKCWEYSISAFFSIIQTVSATILFICEFLITKKYINSADENKETYIDEWKNVKYNKLT